MDAVDETGYQALHYAALNGHIDAMKLLLKKGAIIQDKSIQVLSDMNAKSEVMACLLRAECNRNPLQPTASAAHS